MPNTLLPARPTGELARRLANVRYIFTDFDGTMLAPGSCALRGNEGEPTLTLVSALVKLAQAGIEVIPCSGRNRTMLQEDARVLGFNSYIGEMGGLLMLDLKGNRWEYFTGDLPYDPASGLTPHQVIEGCGVLDQILERWPHLIEYHNDMSTGYKYREVTIGMRGEVPDEDVQAMLDGSGMSLVWGNNGYLTHVSAPTTLELPEGVSGRAFNIMPTGVDKGQAVKRFCELRGIDPAQTLAIGDAMSDCLMAEHVGTFLLVENGLKNPDAAAFLDSCDNAMVAPGRIVNAWAAMADAVLTCQE